MTPKQELFIREYLVDRNGTQAAIRAGYSPRTANEQAVRLLADVSIRSRVDALLARALEKAELSVDMVLASIARELTFDPADLYDADGNLKPIHEIPEDTRKCLVGVEAIQIGGEDSPAIVRKVKWVTPAQAREQAMKHLGMFERDNAQKTDPVRDLIMAIQGNSIRPKRIESDD